MAYIRECIVDAACNKYVLGRTKLA